MKFNYNKVSVFTYIVADKLRNTELNKKVEIRNTNLNIFLSENTEYIYSDDKKNGIYIIGLCIDSYAEIKRENIALKLKDYLQDFDKNNNFFEFYDRLAGKFVILIKKSSELFILGDATGSLQVNYNIQDKVLLSSSEELVARELQLKESDYSVSIRKGANLSQPMPYMLTMYADIKILLPGYYLDTNTNKLKLYLTLNNRIVNTQDAKKEIAFQIELIKNILKEYRKYYKVTCPLTSGYDSRLNFAFIKEIDNKFKSYTFKHGFSENSSELKIPRKICDNYSINYFEIDDLSLSDEEYNEVSNYIGKYQSKGTLDLAFTYKNNYNDLALINGDIVDQIGKSLLGNSLPDFTANSSFLLAKLHNCNENTKKEVYKHILELNKNFSKENIFDVFSLQNRLGRWASQTNTLYSLMGVNSLNIYNSGKIIKTWMTIPRKLRASNYIHNIMFKAMDENLLTYCFNHDDKFKTVKKVPFLFWISTYVKQFLNCKGKK